MKTSFKTGDTVELLWGDEKGKQGKVLKIDRKNSRVLVEGLGMLSHYTRKSEQNPKGGIVQKEGYLHISKVRKTGDAAKKQDKKDTKKAKTAKK